MVQCRQLPGDPDDVRLPPEQCFIHVPEQVATEDILLRTFPTSLLHTQ
ncbi:hypothetical protein ACT01T_24005 [Enterobacter asburiae]|uniref:Uncharacterized protein n=1 Tax=Enterobacter rongchengensis TaxID=3030999 RepID=A0ABV4JLK0_9ENTR|nr:hypothetical protein [Enterobacter asburiae]EPY94133.1 hypothetical protein L799_23035 [Enterobacter roggenkampii EC_38VIM1]MBE7621296.1 hypothetical protein [Escherichia coli]UOY63514.1 hypothetical protein LCD44_11320 [Enterobacter asburiae]HBZ8232106.1 hypothetical protein [Escherichia coli]HBZ8422712.1 hypothetical protein [Escherichia coli]